MMIAFDPKIQTIGVIEVATLQLADKVHFFDGD
jgi:hypothetical protein